MSVRGVLLMLASTDSKKRTLSVDNSTLWKNYKLCLGSDILYVLNLLVRNVGPRFVYEKDCYKMKIEINLT